METTTGFKNMKKLIALFSIITILSFSCSTIISAQAPAEAATAATADTLSDDALNETGVADTATVKTPTAQDTGIHQSLKRKFIEGNAGFMSLVALALVLGLAFCIERIIYLSLSEIDAKRFVGKLEDMIVAGEIEQAKALSRDTRGPVASICYQGLLRIDDSIENIERSVTSYGSVGDISPTIVASGMKVALITTIFGIIVALVLQIFYNYILSKIDHITAQMEESAISLLDAIMKYKLKRIHNS